MRTIGQLAKAVHDGALSADAAAVIAMDRRDAGLCDECDNHLEPGHDFERDHLCPGCRATLEADQAEMECENCGKRSRDLVEIDDSDPSVGYYSVLNVCEECADVRDGR